MEYKERFAEYVTAPFHPRWYHVEVCNNLQWVTLWCDGSNHIIVSVQASLTTQPGDHKQLLRSAQTWRSCIHSIYRKSSRTNLLYLFRIDRYAQYR